MKKNFKIPKEVLSVIMALKQKGFQAYIVGGCVRDLLAENKPKDWDITTNAKPDQIQEVFPENYSDNKFGTIAVLTNSEDESLKVIEITPFRTESKYSDKRRPDSVEWVETIEEDLDRRDFTINAMAVDINIKRNTKSQAPNPKSQSNPKSQIPIKPQTNLENIEYELIDLHNGQEDLKNKLIKTVGDPRERFQEDALRLMRAVRLATTLNLEIEEKTLLEIKNNASLLGHISQERIRDEFLKIINAPDFTKTEKSPGQIFKNPEGPVRGIELLKETGLLQFIMPELLECVSVAQNKHHIYDVYEHLMRSLNFAVKEKYNTYVRLAALLHDISKPESKEGQGEDSTFYNHEVLGARKTKNILTRLKFGKKDIEKITKLVRYHLFYYNTDEVGEASVRRLVKNVGCENIEELLQVRKADRIGSGVPKAEPYKLRHLRYIIEKVSKDPISAKMIAISGNDIMNALKIKAGPKIGNVLNILLADVLDDPRLNKKEILFDKIKEINKFSDAKIEKLAKQSKEKIEKIEMKQDKMAKDKYWLT